MYDHISKVGFHIIFSDRDVYCFFDAVAYKRFADNVPLAIDQELIIGLEEKLLPALYTGLGIFGPNGQQVCKELMQESPQIADRREELDKKLERLHTASRELLQIGL
jgi:hypothetical protein